MHLICTSTYIELKVKYYNLYCHKKFLLGIRVTTSQAHFVAYLKNPSTSRCITVDIVNLLM